jgi:hypothetical protein
VESQREQGWVGSRGFLLLNACVYSGKLIVVEAVSECPDVACVVPTDRDLLLQSGAVLARTEVVRQYVFAENHYALRLTF